MRANSPPAAAALVTGSAGTGVYWECLHGEGYSYLELGKHSRSAETVYFNERSGNQRSFHLVIPAGVMDEGTKYKFRLVATNEKLGTSEATTIIETVTLPKARNCRVRTNIAFDAKTL